MGFASIDDLVSEITTGGKYIRAPFFKQTSNSGAGSAGRNYSMWSATGLPAAGTFPGSAGAATQNDDTTTGSLYHGGNVSTDTKHALNVSILPNTATLVPGYFVLVDRLLHYPSLDATAATALTNGVSLPRSTTGEGVMAFLEVTTAFGATAASFTLTYTNQSGTASRTSAAAVAPAASLVTTSLCHSAMFVALQAGDRGIRSVQSYAINTVATGTFALTLCKPILAIPVTTNNTASERDLLYQLPSLPKIDDGACLQWLFTTGANMAASSNFQGALEMGWG